MRIILIVTVALGGALAGSPSTAARAQFGSLARINALNRQLQGRVVDFTHNHGHDRRIDSAILGMKRDLYVYLPPGYDPCRPYPLLLCLHGGFGDEHAFLKTANLPALDRLIASGCVPPFIAACPDGNYSGRNWITSNHSLYANGLGGRFEDHVMFEVIPFLTSRYRIRPEREARAVTGVSAGGTAAMSLAMKHREFFGVAGSISGGVNLRYDNCFGDYSRDFSPTTYRWKTVYEPDEVIAELLGGLLKVRAKAFIEPVFGTDPGVVERVSRWNPADLLFTTDLRPGDLRLYVSYGARDQLNFDAHAESFVWLASGRGIPIDVERDPEGDHGFAYFREACVRFYRWFGDGLPRE